MFFSHFGVWDPYFWGPVISFVIWGFWVEVFGYLKIVFKDKKFLPECICRILVIKDRIIKRPSTSALMKVYSNWCYYKIISHSRHWL